MGACCLRVSLRTKEMRCSAGLPLAGVVGGLLGLPPPAAGFSFSFNSFFFVEKKRKKRKGLLGIKKYDTNFYKMSILKKNSNPQLLVLKTLKF